MVIWHQWLNNKQQIRQTPPKQHDHHRLPTLTRPKWKTLYITKMYQLDKWFGNCWGGGDRILYTHASAHHKCTPCTHHTCMHHMYTHHMCAPHAHAHTTHIKPTHAHTTHTCTHTHTHTPHYISLVFLQKIRNKTKMEFSLHIILFVSNMPEKHDWMQQMLMIEQGGSGVGCQLQRIKFQGKWKEVC